MNSSDPSSDPPDYFGKDIADRYDAASAAMFEAAATDPVVDFLAHLAGNGAALEFGIGTGRIALPLARRGVAVHGIDLSVAMIAKLRQKAGSQQIGLTIGNFANAVVEAKFSVVYLVFNTIMNLTTQDEQVACFQNAARHLVPGGHFVIEVLVPALQRLPIGQTIHPFNFSSTAIGLDEIDVVAQREVSHHFSRDGDVWRLRSIPFRYAWPAEMDLMARLAGMNLRERWANWKREPFAADSTKHVSVWQITG